MTRARLFRLWICLGLILPAAAFAQTAYTTASVNLRAGPSRDYPLVARIPPGAPVEVAGCVDGWTWCDVIVGPDRGWAYAGNLVYPYQNRRVSIITGGVYMGLPIVPFVVGPYWDNYYRGRPWYGRRRYWVDRPWSPHRPGIRPPGPRPPVVRPPVVRPGGPRPPRPHVNRPPVAPVRPGHRPGHPGKPGPG